MYLTGTISLTKVVDPGIALGLVCIPRVVAATASRTGRRSTTSSNHEYQLLRAGSKLTAHWHHGRVPAASRFEQKALHHGSDSALTTELFQRCFSGLSVPNLIFF